MGKTGLLLRCAAKTIDFILVAAASEIIPKAGFFGGLAYLLISDGLFDGRSLGKKLIGLRVVSSQEDRGCSIKESILRNLIFVAGLALWKIPFIGWIFIALSIGFELILILGSKDGMRLGDEIAKTKVIEQK